MNSVLILTNSFPRNRNDVSGRFIREFADRLKENGSRIAVLCPDGQAVDRGADLATSYPVRRFRYFFPRSAQSLAYGSGMPDNLRRSPWLYLLAPFFIAAQCMATMPLAKEYDVLHAHWAVPSGLSAYLLKCLGVVRRFVVTLHSSDLWYLRKRNWGRFLLRRMIRAAEAMNVVSREAEIALKEVVESGDHEKISVIPMGVDWESFENRSCAAGDNETLRVLFMGRLVPIKGVDILIRAMRGIPKAKLMVCGDGLEKKRLQRLAIELGVKAVFTGALSGLCKKEALSGCDIMAFPSRTTDDGCREGTPVTLLEGMAAARPVIASASGGIPEIIRDGEDGILVSPDDVSGLRHSILRLAGDAALRSSLGNRARLKVQPYSWNNIVCRYQQLYELSDSAGRK